MLIILFLRFSAMIDEMTNDIQKLQEEGRTHLAHVLETYGNTDVFEYSKAMWDYKPTEKMEVELEKAFKQVLDKKGLTEEQVKQIMNQLDTSRVIQTTPHTQIVPTPRNFCIDWISTRGIPTDFRYLVASFSGVPFSNPTKPGRITLNGETYNFVSAIQQDELVYKSQVNDRTMETWQSLETDIIPEPKSGEVFSDWANQSAEQIVSNILNVPTTHIDINEVIALYLQNVITQEGHLFHTLFYDLEFQKKFFEVFGDEIHLFFAPTMAKKYHKQEKLYLDGYTLKGEHTEHITDPAVILEGLQNKTLCPAPILVFTALAFLNQFKCLGSFAQVEYLPDFQEKWIELGIDQANNVPTENLTSGMFPENPELNPLDILTGAETLPEPSYTVYELFKPILDKGLLYTSNKR